MAWISASRGSRAFVICGSDSRRRSPVGAVLVRGGGRLSVLQADGGVSRRSGGRRPMDSRRAAQRWARFPSDEVGHEEFAVWVLPPGTTVRRRLRFTHVAAPTETTYHGWLGGAFVLGARMINAATERRPSRPAATTTRPQNQRRKRTTTPGRMGQRSRRRRASRFAGASRMGPDDLAASRCGCDGVNLLWPGFSAADVQAYTGPADRHPREATGSRLEDGRPIGRNRELRIPLPLGVNWLDFGQPVTTRALRLRITQGGRRSEIASAHAGQHPRRQAECGSARCWRCRRWATPI